MKWSEKMFDNDIICQMQILKVNTERYEEIGLPRGKAEHE